MQVNRVIDAFCECKGLDRDCIMGMDKREVVRTARHMLYLILRDKCGISSYKLASLFGRARRNIVRSISVMKNHISIYQDVYAEYHALVKKIEDIVETMPSEDMG